MGEKHELCLVSQLEEPCLPQLRSSNHRNTASQNENEEAKKQIKLTDLKKERTRIFRKNE